MKFINFPDMSAMLNPITRFVDQWFETVLVKQHPGIFRGDRILEFRPDKIDRTILYGQPCAVTGQPNPDHPVRIG